MGPGGWAPRRAISRRGEAAKDGVLCRGQCRVRFGHRCGPWRHVSRGSRPRDRQPEARVGRDVRGTQNQEGLVGCGFSSQGTRRARQGAARRGRVERAAEGPSRRREGVVAWRAQGQAIGARARGHPSETRPQRGLRCGPDWTDWSSGWSGQPEPSPPPAETPPSVMVMLTRRKGVRSAWRRAALEVASDHKASHPPRMRTATRARTARARGPYRHPRNEPNARLNRSHPIRWAQGQVAERSLHYVNVG